MKLAIPEPCKISLNDMKPVDGGYHCDACAHSVVDFRDWNTHDIQQYFKEKNGQRVCGIIHPPKEKTIKIYPSENTFYKGISRLFLVALLFTFASLFSGCDFSSTTDDIDSRTLGMMSISDTTKTAIDSIASDTAMHVHTIGFLIPDIVKYQANFCNTIQEDNSTKFESLVLPKFENDTLQMLEIKNSDSNIDDEIHDPFFLGIIIEIPTQFPGGENALAKFLKENITYPDYEKKNKIEGWVYVSFYVEEDGGISNIKIERDVENAIYLSAEVIRVIQLMPKWKPGKTGNKPNRVKFNLPIEFSL